MGFRITILIALASVSYLGLIGNIYNLQIRKGDHYSAKAASLYNSLGTWEPARGTIYFTDRRNNAIPASINRNYPTIFSDNRKIEDVAEISSMLGEILNIPSEKIAEKLSRKNSAYSPLIKRASKEMVEAIKNANIKGIHIEYEPARFYPFEKMASHLLGYVSVESSNNNGLYGAEAYYNKELKGELLERSEDDEKGPFRGEDVYLTIDRSIQDQAEKILNNLVTEYGARGGTIIVQDPKTGKILAMVNLPNFDPNNYSKYDIESFLNPAVQSIYEPGSILKVITLAAGIDSGSITPETTYTDTGSVTLNTKTIRNANLKKYGRISMRNVMEHSVNTGAVFVERKMGHNAFYDYLVRFGLNRRVGIDLPGEVSGSLRPLEISARDINFATASFGQGISVTPISLINAISTIANGGIMMKPSINAHEPVKMINRVITKESSDAVIEMMVSAVNENKIAVINGYNVAGKTGTAQVPDFRRGGYTDEVINTYTGFVPAYNPRFVILVKLDKPVGAPQAGRTVVPAFRELAEFMLNYYNVPPDNVK